MKIFSLGLSVVSMVFMFGCGGGSSDPNKPVTVPVTGKVVDRSGKALSQGHVEFVPTKRGEGAAMFINGEIQKDGSFTLNTTYGKEKMTGAPEGQYDVTVVTDPKGLTPPATLTTKYTVKSGDNLTIKLEK